MGTPTAHNSKAPAIYLAVLVCIPAALARPSVQFAAAPQHSTARFVVKPGTPAVAASSRAAAAPTDSSRHRSQDTDAGGGYYGWLYPVLGGSRRGKCVVYQAKGSESLQEVATLFSLSTPRVLADNQGVITDAAQALGGSSILLCGRYGAAAPGPVTPAAAAKANAASQGVQVKASRPVSRSAMQTAAPAAAAASAKEQEQALLQLKAVVDPSNSVLKDWGPSQVAPESRVSVVSHCTWTYVACDSSSNVIRLNMVYLGLEGKLPQGSLLAKFPQLKELYLGGNVLQGPLPADWASTTALTHIYLNDNQLTGQLPAEWGNMKTLRVLSLTYNQLTGPLPASWGNLKSLQDLKLNNDQLSGPVPQSWGGMDALATITLWNNPQLSGCLPASWAGKGSSGKGLFQTPTGVLTSDVSVATVGTKLSGLCTSSGSQAAAASAPASPAAATAAVASPFPGQGVGNSSQERGQTPPTAAPAATAATPQSLGSGSSAQGSGSSGQGQSQPAAGSGQQPSGTATSVERAPAAAGADTDDAGQAKGSTQQAPSGRKH